MAGRNLEELQKRYNRIAPDKKKGPGPMGPGRRMSQPRAKGKPGNTGETVKRLWKYVSHYKFRLLLVILCMLTSTLTSLAASYIMRPLINDMVYSGKPASEKLKSLALMLLLMGGIYLVGIASTYIQARLMLRVSTSASEKIRNDLFNKLQSLPVKFFDSETVGGIMSRFTNDIDNIDTMMNQTITQLISGLVTLAGTFCLMIYTSRVLTLVVIAFIPLLLLGGQFVARRSAKYYTAQQAALGAVNGYIEESVTGQKVVKVFNHEEACVDEFELLNNDMRSKQMGAQFFGGIMGPVMGNITQICYGVTAGVGGLLCIFKGFDVGGVSIFANYSRQFAQPINMISMQTSTIFAALAGAERVFKIMDADPENINDVIKDEFDGIEGRVELKDVTFGYIPEKTVLRNISLVAEPGKKIAFVGSTGAGKTTITNLINRFYDIDSGEITVDGRNIKDIDRFELRRNIAMVLQDTHLFTGTIMENIRYGRLDATDDEVVQAAKTASAHSFIMRLSDGYNTVIEGDGANLSQGQRQLLNIARAAISKAPILVLDEATSSVDTRTERHIEHGMDRLMKNRTTFVIAHRLSTVRNSDAIMVLEKGEIIERGNHEELLALKGRYYELCTGVRELD
ncbi:MAG: ABC transporter ATP-binding protein [Clostridia bacterium]|nr:ABC transporter ATP-binding protein [Clostridia bacterium]